MSKIEIKHITQYDPELVEPIGRLLDQLPSHPVNFSNRALRAIIESDSSLLMVMFADAKPVGMITLGHYLAPTGRKIWIEDVVVDSSMRGRGLGKKLIDYAIEQARTLAPATLLLTSRPSRIDANALYRTSGFKQRETNVYKFDISK